MGLYISIRQLNNLRRWRIDMTRILRDIYENEYAVLRAHSDQCRRQYRLTFSRWADQLKTEPTTEHLSAGGADLRRQPASSAVSRHSQKGPKPDFRSVVVLRQTAIR